MVGAVIATTLAAGCADSGAPSYLDRDVGVLPDAGVSVDAPPPFNPEAGAPADAMTGGREATDVACADFVDDDGNGAIDCADTAGCGTRPICCVGSTASRCCAPPRTLAPVIALDACTSSVITDCVSGMSTFGSPTPQLVTMRADGGACASGASLAPQGSDRSDGGLVSTSSIDTTTGAVAIEARLGVSTSAASTLDAIAVGLTDQSDLATTSLVHVRPSVSVLVSATDQTIRAIAGDVAFPTHPLASILTGSCSELEVRIVTNPAGTFDAFYRIAPSAAWITLESARPFQPTPSAHVIAYGRSTNPGIDGVHAWVRSVSTSTATCDVMDPIRAATGAFTTLPSGAHAIRSVSRVGSIAVYEMDGAIYAAGVDGTGHLQALGRTGADGDRILAPGEMPFMASGLADPELVAIDENRRLFFTAIDAAGTRSIGYLDFDTTVALRVTGSTPRQIVPPAEVHAMHADGPAYFETHVTGIDGSSTLHRWIVFRAVVDATHSELRAAELAGSSALLGVTTETRDVAAPAAQFYTSASPYSADQALYANRVDDAAAFDHDEIAAPEIIVQRGVVRVFFAARRGARWSIGMLRSPDFAHFELAYPDAVLTGSGAGFDAVSVSDPDVAIDTSGTLTLYYTATDGTVTQPGLATQEVGPP